VVLRNDASSDSRTDFGPVSLANHCDTADSVIFRRLAMSTGFLPALIIAFSILLPMAIVKFY
jgi:hypothetical protein